MAQRPIEEAEDPREKISTTVTAGLIARRAPPEAEAALNAVTAKAYGLAGAELTQATPVPKKAK